MCHHGQHMSKLINNAMYMHDDEVYERYSRHRKPMRVEIPHTYTYVREQLRVMMEAATLRHAPRREEQPKPRIHTDEHRRKEPHRRSESTEVVIESAHSDKHRRREKYRHEEPRERKYREHRYRDAEYRHEYRHEEKKDKERRRAAETDVEINVKEKKYRTQDRRPTWVDEDVKARR